MPSRSRRAILVLFLAVAAYANSLGNGFAYDDVIVLTQNATVTTGDWRGALARPWWPPEVTAGGLYRPLTSASFAAEWRLFSGTPLGFHALNVLAHAAVCLLLFALLLELAPPIGAFAGAALFAIHPVHTEAVANVVGRAELYAAAFYLAACVLYWRGRSWSGGRRALRLAALGLLYFLALASKEIGITLPAALLLLELYASHAEPSPSEAFRNGVRRETATWVLLGGVLLAYLALRWVTLGGLLGDRPAPIFDLIGRSSRVLTAVAIWLQYARLLLFPLNLASDYDPGVLYPSVGLDATVVIGGLCLATLAIVAVSAWQRLPQVTLGILFFALAILPVSNLLFSTGTLLAERTLYLPSVGLSLVVAGLAGPALALRNPWPRAVVACAALAGCALFARTVTRNPAWLNSFVVLQTLNDEHPESWRSIRARAQGLERVGELAQAAEEWDRAVVLAPTNYTLLLQAAVFHERRGDASAAEAYIRRALALEPDLLNAYQHLGAHFIRRGEAREARRVALAGLARTSSDPELWEVVSASYLATGDLPAAVRAHEAALGAAPGATTTNQD